MKVRCRAVDAEKYAHTGKSKARWTAWKKNLVLDAGLNAFAGKSASLQPDQGAASFSRCQVGTSAAAQTFQSGAITFTQVGTTITASATFFTAAMVGAIIKFGNPGTSNGAEQYIASQTGTACVVSGAGMTVGSPTAGTVFLVQQTALTSALLSTSTYQTSGSSCGTTVVGNVITLQRTFNFAVQGSPYNANEIGWSNANSLSFTFGRLVLASTISVATSQFLQVQLQMVMTFSPSAPVAVTNVGTAIDTSGNAMLEIMSVSQVSTTGTLTSPTGSILGFSGGGGGAPMLALRTTTTYTQNSAPLNAWTSPSWAASTYAHITTASWVYTAGTVGICTVSFLTQSFTTAGESLLGIGFITDSSHIFPVFDVKLTTPFTLPVGSFQPQCIFTLTFTRTLTC